MKLSAIGGFLPAIMVIVIIFILSIFILSRCYDESGATKTLNNSGFTNVTIHGRSWFKCSKNGMFSTKFSATGPTGAKVTGAVCGGWLAGNVIRLDD